MPEKVSDNLMIYKMRMKKKDVLWQHRTCIVIAFPISSINEDCIEQKLSLIYGFTLFSINKFVSV